jgi:hypothetical protein
VAEYRRTTNALPETQFAALRDALMSSPFVAKSTLNGTFQTSRGFGVAFTAAGRPQVEQRIPQLMPFFRLAIDGLAEKRLQSFWQRGAVPKPNAWYLNLLLVGTGGGVGPHVDATLAKAAGVDEATPRAVSVLYLKVPKSGGGELVLARGSSLKGVVRPVERTLLHFRGDLTHQVRALQASDGGAVRASLVLEQYSFGEASLERLPAFRLDSRAKFQLALAAAAKRPAPQLDFER